MRQGRTADALAAFDRALKLDDTNADAWKGRGLALERAGDRDGAVEVERRPRGPVTPGAAPRVPVRARAGRFELRDGDADRPIEPGARWCMEPWVAFPPPKLWRLMTPWNPRPFDRPTTCTVSSATSR